MISIDAFEVNIPNNLVSIMALEKETALPKAMLSIYRLIYGLNTVPIATEDPEKFILEPIENIFLNGFDFSHIRYVIFPHTASFLLPSGSYLSCIKNKYHLNKAIFFEMSMYKCVSYFKAIEILSVLLDHSANDQALIVTGEIAFTPQLRVVPGSTLVGDAATATLFSTSGKNHRLLSVSNKIIKGFEKGIYLTSDELNAFNAIFIQAMKNIILDAILKANIQLHDIAIILPHNVNIPTWKKIASMLQFPIEKIYLDNIPKLGHCFCSDHIINLKSALSENRLKKDDYYLMAGCGLGFYLSVAVFQY